MLFILFITFFLFLLAIPSPFFAASYDYFTGLPINETTINNKNITNIQLDTAGLYIMCCYSLFLHEDCRPSLREMEVFLIFISFYLFIMLIFIPFFFFQPRIKSIITLLQCKDYENLFPADYSIWGELINPSDKTKINNRAYHAYTQAFAYAGLMAGSKVCFFFISLAFIQFLRTFSVGIYYYLFIYLLLINQLNLLI